MKRCCRAILVSLLLVPVEARADNSFDPLADFADPRKLLAEGRALVRKGKYIDACPKFEESIRLDASLGAEFDLADCNDRSGKVASAWAGFREVATRSTQAERKKEAMQRMLALEKKLPKLVIDVSNAAPGLEVRRDGIAVGQVEWGTEIPVDPGKHRVVAWLPGRPRWITMVESTEGATTRVQVPQDLGPPPETVALTHPLEAPALTIAPPPVLPQALPVASKIEPNAPTSSSPPPVVEEAFWTQTNIGLVVGGVGIASLAAGAAFGLASLGGGGDATEYCRGNRCTTRGGGSRDGAIHNGDAATVATTIGVVAIAGALIMIFTAPRTAPARR